MKPRRVSTCIVGYGYWGHRERGDGGGVSTAAV